MNIFVGQLGRKFRRKYFSHVRPHTHPQSQDRDRQRQRDGGEEVEGGGGRTREPVTQGPIHIACSISPKIIKAEGQLANTFKRNTE